MNEPLEDRAEQREPTSAKEPPSPDDLVKMYGSFLFVAVPVILIVVVAYFIFR